MSEIAIFHSDAERGRNHETSIMLVPLPILCARIVTAQVLAPSPTSSHRQDYRPPTERVQFLRVTVRDSCNVEYYKRVFAFIMRRHKCFREWFRGARADRAESSSAPVRTWRRAVFSQACRLSLASVISGVSLWLSVLLGGEEAGAGVFPFLFPASVVGAWTGGLAGGMLATIILAFGAAFYHLPPAGIAIGDSSHLFALCAFILSGFLIAWLVGALQYHRDLAKYTLLSVGDGVITTDRRNCVRVMNPLAEALTGWSKKEAFGKRLAEVFRISTPTLSPDIEALAVRAMRERRVLSLPEDAVVMSKSGNGRPLSDSVAPIKSHYGDVIGAVIVFRDVTERKRIEAARLEAETNYREIFENAVVGMFQSTLDGRYLKVNRAMAVMCGYISPQEMIEAMSGVPHQENPNPGLRDEFRRLLEEKRVVNAFPLEVLRRDGTRLSTIVSARIVCDAGGKILYYEGTQEDITDRKRLQARLVHAEKLEAIGRLAGGVAHDFNNILGVIFGYSELAREKVDKNHPIVSNLNQISDATARSARLTRQLLTFGRRQLIQPTVLDLNKIVSGLSHMLERLVGEDIKVSFKPGTGLGLIMADPGQMEQVLMNLAINARDAMPAGGEIRIETGNVSLDQEYRMHHPSSIIGPSVMLTFSDTGYGIEKDLLPKIFEPFFTTKDPSRGTGLGLATVYGIVKQSNGNIWVYSEPGMGTTFKIYFPRTDLSETSTMSNPQTSSVGGTETVLVVEDDVEMRELVATLLEAAGYKVLKPDSAITALELAQTTSANFDLLLTDIIMPDMNGVDLYDRIRALRPGTKRLYMTGYAGDDLGRRGLLEAETTVLEKPFDSITLLAAVRAVLDRGNL
jgi:two-component system cell cycle sensor histidine kinase/response regulator CckA